eukprot:TRINITY_DN3186_c0_g1_i3.p1 TRINITY_DN3186_c0_g1~~TRINITY_DN3186_c0_g1_i3.p1  ORF type:complete len:575 (-),score=190.79 TRINITY_DN3186_c0_g1_i3:138-1862(-)
MASPADHALQDGHGPPVQDETDSFKSHAPAPSAMEGVHSTDDTVAATPTPGTHDESPNNSGDNIEIDDNDDDSDSFSEEETANTSHITSDPSDPSISSTTYTTSSSSSPLPEGRPRTRSRGQIKLKGKKKDKTKTGRSRDTRTHDEKPTSPSSPISPRGARSRSIDGAQQHPSSSSLATPNISTPTSAPAPVPTTSSSSSSSSTTTSHTTEEPEPPPTTRVRSNAFYARGLPAYNPATGEVSVPDAPSVGPPRPQFSMGNKSEDAVYVEGVSESSQRGAPALPKASSSSLIRPLTALQRWRRPAPPPKVLGLSARFTVGVAETIGRRRTMEDETAVFGCYRDRETDDYFGLFDGHGGREVADFAAQHLHEVLAEHLQEVDGLLNPVKALKQAFQQTHDMIAQREIRGGTTAVIALFIGNSGYVANVGDSRAVLFRDGQTFRVSLDHKPELPKETERIRSLGGEVTTTVNLLTNQTICRVQGQLSVSRALGDTALHPYVSCEPEIHGPLSLSAGKKQIMILACDGVWDVITDEEATALVADIPDPEQAAVRLRDEAFSRGSMDNISALVIHFPPK